MALRSKHAARLRTELRMGTTRSGRPLSAETRRAHILKLRLRVPLLLQRYRIEELARIRELESMGDNPLVEEAVDLQTAPEPAAETEVPDDLYIMKYVGILQDVLKIGRSNNPERRRKGLEACQNFHLELLATFPGKGFLEPEVHKRLAERRSTRGAGTEWFRIDLQGALDAVAKTTLDYERIHPPMPM